MAGPLPRERVQVVPLRDPLYAGSVRTAAGLALLSLLAAAGCTNSTSEGCGGEVIASLSLHGILDDTATGCAVPPPGGWSVPATLPAAPAPVSGQPVPTFPAAFTWDPSTQQLSYCAGGSHAAVLHGTMEGGHVRAEATVGGAVLGVCAATCTPQMTVVVEGDLTGGSGAPATFTGTLTETFDQSAGSCAPCQLPCASVYALAGTGQ